MVLSTLMLRDYELEILECLYNSTRKVGLGFTTSMLLFGIMRTNHIEHFLRGYRENVDRSYLSNNLYIFFFENYPSKRQI